jgi:hypothetical protein
LSISAIGCSKKREYGLVLIDSERLPVTEGPSLGGVIPGDEFQFAKIRCAQGEFSFNGSDSRF